MRIFLFILLFVPIEMVLSETKFYLIDGYPELLVEKPYSGMSEKRKDEIINFDYHKVLKGDSNKRKRFAIESLDRIKEISDEIEDLGFKFKFRNLYYRLAEELAFEMLLYRSPEYIDNHPSVVRELHYAEALSELKYPDNEKELFTLYQKFKNNHQFRGQVQVAIYAASKLYRENKIKGNEIRQTIDEFNQNGSSLYPRDYLIVEFLAYPEPPEFLVNLNSYNLIKGSLDKFSIQWKNRYFDLFDKILREELVLCDDYGFYRDLKSYFRVKFESHKASMMASRFILKKCFPDVSVDHLLDKVMSENTIKYNDREIDSLLRMFGNEAFSHEIKSRFYHQISQREFTEKQAIFIVDKIFGSYNESLDFSSLFDRILNKGPFVSAFIKKMIGDDYKNTIDRRVFDFFSDTEGKIIYNEFLKMNNGEIDPLKLKKVLNIFGKDVPGDCRDIRLDKNSHVLQNFTVSKQGFDDCYAHSGALLVDAYLHQNFSGGRQIIGKPWRTSPLISAILAYGDISSRRGQDYFWDFGQTCDVINSMKKNGICSDENIASLDERKWKAFFHFVKDKDVNKMENVFYFFDVANKRISNLNKAYMCVKEMDVDISYDEICALNSSCQNDKGFQAEVKKMFEKLCPPNSRRFLPKSLKCKTYSENELDIVHDNFNSKHPKPIEISYDSSLLKKNESGGNHSSVLIGRRYNKERRTCQFLIMNSWGDGCGSYKEKWECRNGKIWVDSRELMKSTRNISLLEE